MAITTAVAGGASPSPAPGGGPESAFDPNDLRPTGITDRLGQWFVDNPEWAFRLFRRFWPIPHVPFTKWWMITRFDHVQEVLAHDKIFEVPFGPKVMELNGGPNFLLGMTADADYWRYQKQVMEAFRLDDVERIVAPQSRNFAEQIISRSAGRLDAVQDFIARVPTLLCESYYGVAIADDIKTEFAQWTLAMSTYMFADPTDRPAYRRAALAGGKQVQDVVDRAISAAKGAPTGRDTILERLPEMQGRGAPGLTDAVIRAFLIGMVTGFIPTNTMAAGHMLEMLLRRRDFMAPARAAARAGDDDLLNRCLFEAMRFKPLNPGPFRDVVADYTISSGMKRPKRLRCGAKLLVGTQSAMFDERRVDNPRDFNPGRPPSHYMLFGYGLHWCVGAFIAQAQITQTLKALVLQDRLRRADGPDGQLRLLGPFPEHLIVEFDR
jgi:cytochrome P450